jgi:hypothetical protein
MLVFRRATHSIGGVYIMTPEMAVKVQPVWREHGLIGHMLSSLTFLTLDEMVEEHRRYEKNWGHDLSFEKVSPEELVIGLAKLIEAGAVEVKEV